MMSRARDARELRPVPARVMINIECATLGPHSHEAVIAYSAWSPGFMKGRIAILAAVVIGTGVLGLWVLRRPNTPPVAVGPIIIFSIDTLRADRLPAYGYTKIRTPNIDRFVADGVLFEQAYSHSPQTLPAHASLLTGRLPFEHGVRDNIGFSLREGERMLQQVFKERGCATGGFVSAYVLRHQTGIGQGFDRFDDSLPAASPERPLGQVQRDGAQTVSAALEWIDGLGSERFFAFVHIYEPHRPYSPPERFRTTNPYDGEVQHADEIFGQFVAQLEGRNLYDRATIVLLSDHGEGLGDHGEAEHGIFLYRETIRVPLVIKLPASVGAGRRISAAVQHIDLPPTLLDLSGAVLRDAHRGRSLRPVLTGSGALADASIYSESLSPRYHFGWSELYALTDDQYRFIRAPRDELYDVRQDPDERSSVAAERPQTRAAMRRALESIIGGTTVGAPSAVTAADREKLAALGYVGTQSGTSLSLPGDELPDPKDKVDVLERYKRATDLAGARRFVEAAALYRDVLRDNPEMTDVWLQLAETYGRLNMTAAAAEAYKEVVKRSPKDPAGLTGAAAALQRMGRMEEARAHAELAVDVAPAAAHELLARIALAAGDTGMALREAQLAHEADPSLPLPAFVEGQILHGRGDFAAAAARLGDASRAMSTRTVQIPDLHYYLGDSLGRLERYPEAERAFLRELTYFPSNVRARASLAMLYRATGRLGESDQAVNELTRIVASREAYDVAAQLWTMFGRPDRAAEARAAMRRLPK
jgi:arylsulfatase A-like enzyme/Flp pilus assembly protein TadD